MKYAFRCKACGRLHNEAHAGDNEVPHACCVCDSGVSHTNIQEVAQKFLVPGLTPKERAILVQELSNPSLTKTFHPENWEILADATPEILARYGLTTEDVERHICTRSESRPAKDVIVSATDGLKTKDK